MAKKEIPELPYLSNEDRLQVYQAMIDGCQHIWSKGIVQNGQIVKRKRKGSDGKIRIVEERQEQRLQPALRPLIKLGQSDPYFLAHLVSWIIRNNHKSKDLTVLSVYGNSLSSANGRPFSAKSKYKRPNLRYVSAAAICQMEPKLVSRVRELAGIKFGAEEILNKGSHFPTFLATAIKKYLRYREANPEILRGIKKAGLAKTVQNLYRSVHLAPSDETAAILRWQQKDKEIEFEKPLFDFGGLSDLEIAKRIRKKKIPVLGALGALPHMSPVIAVALLEQATGNQALVLRKTFEDAGVLKDKEVMKLFEKKIGEAKTTIDRVEALSKTASKEVEKAMKKAKSKVRKKETKGIGKIYLMLDFSGSMQPVVDFAKKRGVIIAEVVNNPKENFKWGSFGPQAIELPLPKEFIEDAFAAVLFGKVATGSTDAYGLYPSAREFGADVDILVTDQGHNVGDLEEKIRNFHARNPNLPKPKACVIVNYSNWENTGIIKDAYEANQIPVAVLKPEALTGSALVAQSVREAIKGPMATIDTIMETKLLELPSWYLAI